MFRIEECNFNCWYCYENHPQGRMSRNTMTAVVNYVKTLIKNKSIHHLNLDWFGGEPLLYFDEVMYPLAKEIKQIWFENNMALSGMITTNGLLINKDRCEKFQEISLNSFQITLDGDEQTHNRIRCDKNKNGSFQIIVDNINLLSEYPNVSILLRINYTEKTLLNINNIVNFFSEKAKNKIEIFFQQVWQDAQKKRISAKRNEQYFKDKGFRVNTYELNTSYHACYADVYQQAVINFDGKVFKCTARDFNNTNPDGWLQEDGNIQWDMPKLSKRFSKATFENEHCTVCNLLPVCAGPCSQKMMEIPDDYDFKKICLQGGVILSIEHKLNSFYQNLNQNQ